jgi:hypothetical protein
VIVTNTQAILEVPIPNTAHEYIPFSLGKNEVQFIVHKSLDVIARLDVDVCLDVGKQLELVVLNGSRSSGN